MNIWSKAIHAWLFSLLASSALAQVGVTKVQWLGQSVFRITTPTGKVILTDPWLKANPLTPAEFKNLEALGFVIELEDGFKIRHMGDTGLSGDMRFIADDYKPDLVIMPIGGNFTMGPKEAAYAARELVRVKHVVPMHFGANPLAKGTPQQFMDDMKDSGIQVRVLKPVDSLVPAQWSVR